MNRPVVPISFLRAAGCGIFRSLQACMKRPLRRPETVTCRAGCLSHAAAESGN